VVFLNYSFEAIKEKEWMRQLFKEVYKQCSNELNREVIAEPKELIKLNKTLE